MNHEARRKYSYRRCLAACAEYYAVDSSMICGPSRHAQVVLARHHLVWLLIRRRPDLSYPAVGRMVNKDHRTVMYGISRFALSETRWRRAREVEELLTRSDHESLPQAEDADT